MCTHPRRLIAAFYAQSASLAAAQQQLARSASELDQILRCVDVPAMAAPLPTLPPVLASAAPSCAFGADGWGLDVAAAFNCSALPQCPSDGPADVPGSAVCDFNQLLLKLKANKAVCLLEMYAHRGLQRTALLIFAFLSMNMSCYLLMGSLVRLACRLLTDGVLRVSAVCSAEGRMMGELACGPGAQQQRALREATEGMFRGEQAWGAAQLALGLLVNAPWLTALFSLASYMRSFDIANIGLAAS